MTPGPETLAHADAATIRQALVLLQSETPRDFERGLQLLVDLATTLETDW